MDITGGQLLTRWSLDAGATVFAGVPVAELLGSRRTLGHKNQDAYA